MFRPQDSEPFGPGPTTALAARSPVRRFGRAPDTAPALITLQPANDRTDVAPPPPPRPAPPAPAGWTWDLAEDIGSRGWYRGLATLLGLIALALAFWPDFSTVQAAPASPLDPIAAVQFRGLALGDATTSAVPVRLAKSGPALRPVAYVAERPRVDLATKLPAGDSLERLLLRAGVANGDAGRAEALIAAIVPPDQLPAGTRVDLVLGPRTAPGQPRPLERASLRARLDLVLTVSRAGGGLVLQRQAIAVDTTPLRIRGTVGDSLYRSARAAGAPPGALQEYLRALDSHLNLEADVAPGDSFDLVFAYRRAATGETEAGQLLYAGLDRIGPRGPRPVLELLRWGQDGAFYSAEALARPRLMQSGPGLIAPVNGRITSLFGQRFHPILGYARMHAGVDFGAPWGSPIVAAADGVVSYAGYHGGHGNYVRIDHGGALGTGYGHMSRIAVSPGMRVRGGEVIGYVGSTGLSTGPHLHYEVYQSGRTVDPLGVRMATVARQVDPAELGAFRTRLAQLKALVPGALMATGPGRPLRLAMR